MTKNGRVEIGKTPSVVSGRPSNSLEDNEPVREGEQPADPQLKKLAKAVAEPERVDE